MTNAVNKPNFEVPSPDEMRDMLDAEQLYQLHRGLVVGQLRGSVVLLFVLAAVWGLLNAILPDGWWQAALNIAALLLTAGTAAYVKRILAVLGNPGWLAWLIAMFLWGLAVIGLRSVVLSLLGVWD